VHPAIGLPCVVSGLGEGGSSLGVPRFQPQPGERQVALPQHRVISLQGGSKLHRPDVHIATQKGPQIADFEMEQWSAPERNAQSLAGRHS
jgi:hypothetical protein